MWETMSFNKRFFVVYCSLLACAMRSILLDRLMAFSKASAPRVRARLQSCRVREPLALGNQSIRPQLHNRLEDRLRLRQDRILQNRLIRHKRVHRANPPHRRVERIEQLLANPRGDLRAVAPTEHIFVRYDHAARLPHRLGNCLPVVGIQCPEIENLHVDVVLSFSPLGGLQ